MPEPRAAVYRRRRIAALALLAIAAIAVFVVVVRGGSGAPKRLLPAAGASGDHYDPLAYDADKQSTFESRAAAGVAHLLYEKSPGGAFVTAKRVARWRPLIERAAKAGGVDPDMLEAIVFLESAGRPDVLAGTDIESAAGLGQILAGTATELLHMHVDVAKSKRLTRQITRAVQQSNDRKAAKLRARRRRVDDRFDPAKAIAATVRYLGIAKKQFGRADFAIASYHMGIGNLQTVLKRFGDGADNYARVYFDSTPLLHPSAYRLLSSFGDDSSTYLWRVLAAKEIMRLYRNDPSRLGRLEVDQASADSAERVLHPDAASIDTASRTTVPAKLALLGVAVQTPGALARLRPAALSTLLYATLGTTQIAHGGRLTVTDATGWRFNVARHYRDRAQALAFQFMLDRLQALNLIAWRRGPDSIRVVVAPDAGDWLPKPAKLAADALR